MVELEASHSFFIIKISWKQVTVFFNLFTVTVFNIVLSAAHYFASFQFLCVVLIFV